MTFRIREATPDDAAAVIAHARRIADEPNNGVSRSSAAEFTYTLEEEQAILAEAAETATSLFLVAEREGEIVGVASCRAGNRGYAATCTLGISVDQAHRRQGIATAIMQYMIDWARDNPAVHRLELWVFHDNERAIRLYEQLGFEHEGRQRAGFWKDGEYKDMLLMGIVFDS